MHEIIANRPVRRRILQALLDLCEGPGSRSCQQLEDLPLPFAQIGDDAMGRDVSAGQKVDADPP